MCENGQSSKFSTNFVRLIPLILSPPVSTSTATAAYYCLGRTAVGSSEEVVSFRERRPTKIRSSSEQMPQQTHSVDNRNSVCEMIVGRDHGRNTSALLALSNMSLGLNEYLWGWTPVA